MGITQTSRSSQAGAGGPVRALRRLLTRWLARPLARRKSRHHRAAIVKLDRLGDFVLAVSAIRQVLAHFGEEQCVLLLSPQVAPLAAREFPRTARLVLPIGVGHKRLFWAGRPARRLLGEISCEEVVCLRHQREDWDELVLAWLNAGRTHVLDEARAGQEFAARRTLVHSAADRIRFDPTAVAGDRACRELERHRQLLRHVLGRPVVVAELMPRFEHVGVGAARGGIVVTPFGSAAIRDFPEALLIAALRAVREHSAAPITLHGDEAQQSRLRQLAQTLQAAGIAAVSCAAPVDVVTFAGTVAGADLVVTVETATAHLAATFDRPAVILIGGGHYGEFGPWQRSARQVWVTHQVECFGCNWSCIHPEPLCLTQITAESVHAAVKQALQEGASA